MSQVRVVALPPSGADPAELWLRFSRACDLDPSKTKPGGMSHESLGAASAELMRRLNAHPTIEKMPMRAYQKSVNGALTRRALGRRRSLEPGLALPAAYAEWADREAARLIADIEAVGVEVVGDLEDLKPRPGRKVAVAPQDVPDADLLEAALDGLAGIAAEHAALKAKLAKYRSRKRMKTVASTAARPFLWRVRGAAQRLRAARRRRRRRR